MTVLVAVTVGLLAGRLVWLLARPIFASAVFSRQNYRGEQVATGVGLVLAVATLAVEAGRLLAAAALQDGPLATGARLGTLVLVLGLALAGLTDDLAGGPHDRGFRGHLRAARAGRLTTGALKMICGAAVAVVAVVVVRPDDGLGNLLVDSALVALAANLANLFDRAPGRAIKLSGLAFAVLVVATAGDPRLAGAAIVVGAALAVLQEDLHERVMLGDTGANLLGGAIGLAVVAATPPPTRVAVLLGLAILNGVSERVSFSKVIDGFAPLRVLDRAGRRNPP